MPRKVELTWHGARTCWKKFFKGRHYYLGKGKCKGKSDTEGYKIALAEWAGRYPALLQQKQADIQRSEEPDTTINFATMWDSIVDGPETSGITKAEDTSIQSICNAFLAELFTEAKAGQIGAGQFGNLKCGLEDFKHFAKSKGKEDLMQLDGTFLKDYRSNLMYLMAPNKCDSDHKLSTHTVQKRLQIVGRLFEFVTEIDAVESLPSALPLSKKYSRVAHAPPCPQYFNDEEIKRIFASASRRTKLYIALALNCGYRQIDISTLTNEMIDWNTGIIDRTRHKTHRFHVPQKSKLWPITLDLLKKEAAGTDGIVLRGRNGDELVRRSLVGKGANAKVKHIDVIGLAFNRVRRKTEINKPFKLFRNTGANLVAKQNQKTPELVDVYLAHSEKRMRKHYADRQFDFLFEATDKLNDHFGLKIE